MQLVHITVRYNLNPGVPYQTSKREFIGEFKWESHGIGGQILDDEDRAVFNVIADNVAVEIKYIDEMPEDAEEETDD